MKRAAVLAALLLTACASSQDKVSARFDKWAAACHVPLGTNTRVTAAEWSSMENCMLAMEDAYQAERATNVSRGAVLLGAGATMMAPPAQRGFSCTTTPGPLTSTTTCR